MIRESQQVLAIVVATMGPTSAKGRAGIRSRQVAAGALRRVGATHAQVAQLLGCRGHQGAMALAQRGEQLEAAEPAIAALIREACGDARLSGQIRGRRSMVDLGPAKAPPAPSAGRATIEQVAPNFANIAASLTGPRVNQADADDAVQLVAVAIWHGGRDLPSDPGRARAVLRRYAAQQLHRGKLARWIRERVVLPTCL